MQASHLIWKLKPERASRYATRKWPIARTTIDSREGGGCEPRRMVGGTMGGPSDRADGRKNSRYRCRQAASTHVLFFPSFFSSCGCNVQEAVAERSPRRHLRLGYWRGVVPVAQGEPKVPRRAWIIWVTRVRLSYLVILKRYQHSNILREMSNTNRNIGEKMWKNVEERCRECGTWKQRDSFVATTDCQRRAAVNREECLGNT